LSFVIFHLQFVDYNAGMDDRGAVEGAIAVVERDGAVLLTRRPRGAHLEGYWEFPGGRIEAGETPESCLIRELREELGVEVRVGERLAVLDHTYPEKRVILHCHRCEIVSGEPRPLASEALQWARRDDLAAIRLPPANMPLVALLTASVLQSGKDVPKRHVF
jgi:8-oxo-dGTP diphosphatase